MDVSVYWNTVLFLKQVVSWIWPTAVMAHPWARREIKQVKMQDVEDKNREDLIQIFRDETSELKMKNTLGGTNCKYAQLAKRLVNLKT